MASRVVRTAAQRISRIHCGLSGSLNLHTTLRTHNASVINFRGFSSQPYADFDADHGHYTNGDNAMASFADGSETDFRGRFRARDEGQNQDRGNFEQYFADVSTRFPEMEAGELVATILRVSRYIRGIRNPTNLRTILASPAYRELTRAVMQRLKEDDTESAVRLFSLLVSTVPTTAKHPLEVQKAGTYLLNKILREHATEGKTLLSPETYAAGISAIIRVSAADLSLAKFVTETLPGFNGNFSLSGCRRLLHGLHQLQLHQNELATPLIATLEDQMDTYRNRDVVESLRLLRQTSFRSPTILRHCIALITNHVALFDANQLIEALECFTAVCSSNTQAFRIVQQELAKSLKSIPYRSQIRILKSLFLSPAMDSSLASDIISAVVPMRKLLHYGQELTLAYSVCRFLFKERAALLEETLPSLTQVEPTSMFNTFLLRGILHSASTEFNIKIPEINPAVSAKLQEFDTTQQVQSYVLEETSTALKQLPPEYHLNLETNVTIGPYMMPLVDRENRVAIFLTPRERISNFYMEKRHLESLGYHPVCIPLNRIRRANPAENLAVELERYLLPVMIKMNRITETDAQTIRERQNRDMFDAI